MLESYGSLVSSKNGLIKIWVLSVKKYYSLYRQLLGFPSKLVLFWTFLGLLIYFSPQIMFSYLKSLEMTYVNII